MQTARWSESPGDLQRYGLDQAHILAELGNDQDMLNDLLISTSLGTSVAPYAMRGSNISSAPRVSTTTPVHPESRFCCASACLTNCVKTWRCQACYSVTQLQQMRKGLVETVQFATRVGVEARP